MASDLGSEDRRFESCYPDNEIVEACRDATSKSHVLKLIGKPINGTSLREISKILESFGYNDNFFKANRQRLFYDEIICVCGQTFFVSKKASKRKTTCSYGCSNTKYRSGFDNGQKKKRIAKELITGKHYTVIAWEHHKKECIICSERNIVAVHHYNEVHTDNRPENLIPLCPTHHQYMHSSYRYLIDEKVKEYITKFMHGVA